MEFCLPSPLKTSTENKACFVGEVGEDPRVADIFGTETTYTY